MYLTTNRREFQIHLFTQPARMFRSVIKSIALRAVTRTMVARPAVSSMFRVSSMSFSTNAAKKLSAALKKEFEQEADVLSGDYYEAENNIIKEFLKNNAEWKVGYLD
jgi:hypothetical protein